MRQASIDALMEGDDYDNFDGVGPADDNGGAQMLTLPDSPLEDFGNGMCGPYCNVLVTVEHLLDDVTDPAQLSLDVLAKKSKVTEDKFVGATGFSAIVTRFKSNIEKACEELGGEYMKPLMEQRITAVTVAMDGLGGRLDKLVAQHGVLVQRVDVDVNRNMRALRAVVSPGAGGVVVGNGTSSRVPALKGGGQDGGRRGKRRQGRDSASVSTLEDVTAMVSTSNSSSDDARTGRGGRGESGGSMGRTSALSPTSPLSLLEDDQKDSARDSDLRAENERLRWRMENIEGELQAADQEIRRFRSRDQHWDSRDAFPPPHDDDGPNRHDYRY